MSHQRFDIIVAASLTLLVFNVVIRETQTHVTLNYTRSVAGVTFLFSLFSILLNSAVFFICFHLQVICCWIKGEQGLLSSFGSLEQDWQGGWIKQGTVRGLYARFPLCHRTSQG